MTEQSLIWDDILRTVFGELDEAIGTVTIVHEDGYVTFSVTRLTTDLH